LLGQTSFDIWGADEAVVVLTRDRALIGEHEIVDGMRELVNRLADSRVVRVNERDDMKVAVPYMPGNV
jgi:hypothetical protein